MIDDVRALIAHARAHEMPLDENGCYTLFCAPWQAEELFGPLVHGVRMGHYTPIPSVRLRTVDNGNRAARRARDAMHRRKRVA